MIFIIGGVYQGQAEFAKSHFGISNEAITVCTEDAFEPDFQKRCICDIEQFALAAVRKGLEPKDELFKRIPDIQNVILIANDVSCGIVPMDATLRAWREACGRMNNALVARSDEVWRLFCGIPQKIK